MQPTIKSLEHYISKGYEYAMGIPLTNNMKEFDKGIIIIDDILDNSNYRNGNKTLHQAKGLNSAILTGIAAILNAQETLYKLCQNTDFMHTIKAQQTLLSFTQDIIQGELMDQNIKSVEEYFTMITLFTGNHIAKGIEMGHYIANKTPPTDLLKACQCAGRIRQIVDDFEDYYEEHHEPFGDFLQRKNRLPELLFKGNKTYAKELINNEKYEEARNYILKFEVRHNLYDYCLNEHKKVKELDSRAEEFIVNYEKIIQT
ncbi:hypothetical protein C4573_03285 [Candidatus Woesearchaeota archaeon]|nr:MAG: hypothetical protein C4573_03285 [Candidatus Woesearchaeota archaeon]